MVVILSLGSVLSFIHRNASPTYKIIERFTHFFLSSFWNTLFLRTSIRLLIKYCRYSSAWPFTINVMDFHCLWEVSYQVTSQAVFFEAVFPCGKSWKKKRKIKHTKKLVPAWSLSSLPRSQFLLRECHLCWL